MNPQGKVIMKMELKKLAIFFAVIIVNLAVTNHPALAAAKPPAQGGVLPPFELVVPEDSAAKSYLGISGSGRFTITQIKAKVVILELFSMY
jgi:hypothetical protein